MPRYVILEHDHPFVHWDLMLEAGASLQTWRLAQPPVEGVTIEATQLPDHRWVYLDYEGPVSGNRGIVRRWDAGVFNEEADARPEVRWLRCTGARWCGLICLQHERDERWLCRCTTAQPSAPP